MRSSIISTSMRTAAQAGRVGNRSVHRVVRDVFIADTDAEARKLALEGGMGRAWTEYLLPTYHAFGIAQAMVEGTGKAVSDVTPEFLADHFWLVGSPETVREKMEAWIDGLGGGFGTLLIYSYDYIDNPTPWEESMRRLARKSSRIFPTRRLPNPGRSLMAEQAVLASPPSDVPADQIVDFDIYNPFKGQNDLHVAWMALRESTPHAVVWTPHNGGHWIALDPELIANVFGDSDRFSSFNVLVPKETAGGAYHFIPLSLDPPEHRPYRKILNDNLYSSSVNPLEPKVRALTASLIDNFVANGRCDFVTEFAEQLPLRVFMQLVDLPTEHLPVLKQLADQFTRPDGSMTPAEATTRFMEYVGPILNERRVGPFRLLTAITRGEVFGRPLTDDEALRMADSESWSAGWTRWSIS